ncbi:MAG: glycosyltransferase family 4 protein [Acidimicrobiia bacterium]
MRRDEPDSVLFVVVPAAMGGSNRSLATVLSALGPRLRRVLASPKEGAFLAHVRDLGLCEEHLPLSYGTRWRRIASSLRIARWVIMHRRRLLAIHANASRGLNLAALAGFLSGVPITVWVHDAVATPWGRRLGPVLRLAFRRVHWFAVSDTARQVVVGNGLCRTDQVEIVPNPVDVEAVLGKGRSQEEPTLDRLVVGYLGSASHRKGFDLMAEIIAQSSDLDVEWRLFTRRFDDPYANPIWSRLDQLSERSISIPGPDSDVRRIYDQCDLVLVPSREESFSMVTAEAMLNRIPVVASDLEPLRDLLEPPPAPAGLVFPVGDATAASEALRQLVKDRELRYRMGEEGRRRAAEFRSDRIADRLLQSYRTPASPGSSGRKFGT